MVGCGRASPHCGEKGCSGRGGSRLWPCSSSRNACSALTDRRRAAESNTAAVPRIGRAVPHAVSTCARRHAAVRPGCSAVGGHAISRRMERLVPASTMRGGSGSARSLFCPPLTYRAVLEQTLVLLGWAPPEAEDGRRLDNVLRMPGTNGPVKKERREQDDSSVMRSRCAISTSRSQLQASLLRPSLPKWP